STTLKRASSVEASSARAESANASWGGRRSTAMTGSGASARVATVHHAPADARRLRAAPSVRGLGFRGNPADIGSVTIDDRDGEDLGKFIRMRGTQRRLDRGVEGAARLDGQRDLVGGFDFAPPVIN